MTLIKLSDGRIELMLGGVGIETTIHHDVYHIDDESAPCNSRLPKSVTVGLTAADSAKLRAALEKAERECEGGS